MSAEYLKLCDLLKINDQSVADINVSDVLQDAPFLAALPADTASDGTVHKYLKETGAPTIGFRVINDGRENSKSADTLVTINLQVLDASFDADVALAIGYKKGREAFIAREALRHLKAAFVGAEKQIIYGTDNDAAGYAGMADILAHSNDPMVVDAGGTTAGTGSSVWMVRAGPDDVQAIAGKDGMLEMLETVTIQKQGSTTGTYPAYYTPITGWLGLQNGSAYSFGRICNLTEDSGKGLTDALLGKLYAKFPSTRPPTLILMSRRSREQLRASRTAYSPTGQEVPTPTSWEGIPIITCESISNTETLLTQATE